MEEERGEKRKKEKDEGGEREKKRGEGRGGGEGATEEARGTSSSTRVVAGDRNQALISINYT